MPDYALYLESGPQHKKTMVHVLELLGCVVRGATTEEALINSPAGIRTYLEFLQASGEPFDASAPFTTHIQAHIIGSSWIGEGNPACGFAPDFDSLSRQNFNAYINRLEALHERLFKLIQPLTLEQLHAEPANGHRSVFHILEHSADSEYAYLRQQIGPDKTIQKTFKEINSANPLLPAALLDYWQLLSDRLRSFSDAELNAQVPHGQTIWTAYRTLRRLLEHNWEHCEEIRERLGNQ